MTSCAKCGASLPDDAYFCPECGTRRAGDPPAADVPSTVPVDIPFETAPPTATPAATPTPPTPPARPSRPTPTRRTPVKPGSAAETPPAEGSADEIVERLDDPEPVEGSDQADPLGGQAPRIGAESFPVAPGPTGARPLPAALEPLQESQEFIVAPGRPGGDVVKAARRDLDRSTLIKILLGLLIAVVVIGAVAYFFMRDTGPEPTVPPLTTPGPVATTVATPAPTVVAPGPAATVPPGATLDDKDCSDFSTQADAQNFYRESGGPDQDFHGLDADRNGQACDSETDRGSQSG